MVVTHDISSDPTLTAIPGLPLGWLSATVIQVKDGNVIKRLSPYHWVCRADSIRSMVNGASITLKSVGSAMFAKIQWVAAGIMASMCVSARAADAPSREMAQQAFEQAGRTLALVEKRVCNPNGIVSHSPRVGPLEHPLAMMCPLMNVPPHRGCVPKLRVGSQSLTPFLSHPFPGLCA
jgi:hypothetical protein